MSERVTSIYLAGKMDGLAKEEAMGWRKEVFRKMPEKGYEINIPPYLSQNKHPNLSWEIDYYLLDKSTILLVNFDYDIEQSPFLGTSMEIGRATYQRKPIIIFSSKEWVHNNPTLNYHATAIVNTMEEAIRYIEKWF